MYVHKYMWWNTENKDVAVGSGKETAPKRFKTNIAVGDK